MENEPQRSTTHTMRAMLVANIAVDQRFANGTQGRVLHWSPHAAAKTSKAVPAYSPEILVRFCKESSTTKAEMMSGDSIFLTQITICKRTCRSKGLCRLTPLPPASSHLPPALSQIFSQS